MTKTNANNLGYLGLNFQYQLIKCFFEDARFFSSINHIVDQNMFTEDSLRRIVGYMKDRYNDCNTVATYFDIETMIRTKVTDNTTLSIILSTLDSIRTMPAEGIDLVEEESEKFFKQQNLTKAINQSMEIIKKGNSTDYYVIEDLIKKALETNCKEDFGFRIFDYIDADLADDYRETISTGCKELDDSLYGGLGKGELGLIVSPMGVGKALPLTTRILTPNGYVFMGNIKVGDKVIGSDGKAHKVYGVFPQKGKRNIYELTFSNGTTCRCDEEHLWSARTSENEAFTTRNIKDIIYDIHCGEKVEIPRCKTVHFNTIGRVEGQIELIDSIEKRRRILQGFIDECCAEDNNGKCVCYGSQYTDYMTWIIRSLGGDWYYGEVQMPKDGGIKLKFRGKKFPYADKMPPLYINKVKLLSEQEYTQCIAVDSPDHLYVIENFIVTHNTSITVGLAAAAATQQCEANNFNGFKVLHYFVEDDPSAIRRKYMGYVLDTDACDLSADGNGEITKRRLAEEDHYKPMIQRNILAKRLINGETTASEIRNMIRSNIAAGFKPDLVIVDYFECLKAERGTSIGDSEWTREGLTMRKLESICNEFHVAMWVPVQGTKGSVGQEFVGIQHAGGSVTKTQIGHVVLTLARTDEQKSQSRLNVYLQKFRAARIGRDKFLNVKFNNGTGKFDMSDLTSDSDVDFDNPNAPNMVIAGQMRRGQQRT